MKCPLTLIAFAKGETVIRSGLMDCQKEECAWWNKRDQECSFLTSSKLLNEIAGDLADMKKLMPTWRQFGK